ncbi:hypothetical protein GTW69_30700 [Streptomyces sp. SID7760]|nr:hypothetical protein [Streptomyces sp. SID7760]
MTYHLAYAPPIEPWREQAACAGRSDVFFPRHGTPTDETAAQTVCADCPVTVPCLATALVDEGKAPAYARVGVRGGHTPVERARLAGVVADEVDEPDPFAEMDRLLQLGTMTDKDVAERVGAATVTVHRRRQKLGLPPVRLRLAPEEVFAANTVAVRGGHLVYLSTAQKPAITVNGQAVLVVRFAFARGHGRQPEGQVHRVCAVQGCIAWEHLSDAVIRGKQRSARQQLQQTA